MRICPTTRWWKRLAIGLGMIVAVALLANGFMAWRTNRQLQARAAAMRSAGDPASISDLAPKPIADEQNAAAVLEKLAPRFSEFSKAYTQFLTEDPIGVDYEPARNRGEPASPQHINAIRAIIGRFPDIDAGITAAAACNKYASLADYSLDHHQFLEEILKDRVTRIRTAARFLDWRVDVLLADERHEQAVERGIELLRLARLHDAEPLLVNYLVGVAVRGMACNLLYDALADGPVPAELHAAVEKELALHDSSHRLLQALTSDRAYSTSVAAEGGASPAFDQWRPFYARMIDWPMKRYFLGAADYLDAQVTFAAESWPSLLDQVGRAGALAATDFGVMADLLVPAIKASSDAEMRIVAVMRSQRIFNALRQFAADHGREAMGLVELELPAATTIDPYSGKPLLLKHTSQGWIVYSVMKNGIDDGGDFKGLKDYGVAPTKWRSTE